jgi:hypothetical protein
MEMLLVCEKGHLGCYLYFPFMPPRGLDLACQLPSSSQVSIFNRLFDVLLFMNYNGYSKMLEAQRSVDKHDIIDNAE